MSWHLHRSMFTLPLVAWCGLSLWAPLTAQEAGIPKAVPLEEEEATAEEEEDIPEAKLVPEPAPARQEVIPEARLVPDRPTKPQPEAPAKEEPALQASMRTQADARTLYVSLPPPRGLIVDRLGKPLAQNIVAYYPAITFPEGAPMKPEDALQYAKQRVAAVEKTLGVSWKPKDEALIAHYQNRRWLPYLCETVFREKPSEAQLARLPSGVIMHPAYLRVYPHGNAACHIIGSVGKTRPMPVTPLDPKDPYYPELTARDGLELAFEEKLKGTPGQLNMLFDANGNKIAEEMTQRPIPGDTLVTTLDLEFQQICEDELRQHTKRGAFVIMDVQTGDVIALASWPTFDINLFVPSASQAVLDKLTNDKNKPLRGRAFMDIYPPASTFKVITALAGLESGKIKESTTFNCSPSYRIGNRYFRNHTTRGYGNIDMIDALKYSCNTWFYPMALRIGAQELISMSTRMGFGERTGLPIRGEAAGIVPTDEFMLAHHKRKIAAGDLANMSIGQGAVAATPLQVARAMAAVANGEFVPQSRLVTHLQDMNNKITEAFPPAHRNELNMKAAYFASVRKGMNAVVNEGGGTGRSAANRYVTTAGKTGTAQWSGGRNMAWFAGFLPVKDPQYAFAAIYEGDYGESSISGGRKVAPLVSDVFNRIYKLKKERSEPMSGKSATLAKNKKKKTDGEAAEAGEEGDETEEPVVKRRPRKPATETATASTAPSSKPAASGSESKPKEQGVRGFFRRLFGRNN